MVLQTSLRVQLVDEPACGVSVMLSRHVRPNNLEHRLLGFQRLGHLIYVISFCSQVATL